MPTFLDNIKYYDTDGDLCDIENQINWFNFDTLLFLNVFHKV